MVLRRGAISPLSLEPYATMLRSAVRKPARQLALARQAHNQVARVPACVPILPLLLINLRPSALSAQLGGPALSFAAVLPLAWALVLDPSGPEMTRLASGMALRLPGTTNGGLPGMLR